MKIDRTKNAARNITWGVLEKILAIVLPFVARTVLLKLLGEKYLGMNGLFSSILQVLNMADLGIGVAIVYSMYKPIAEDDEDAICALLGLYKKLFRIIGCVVLALGLALLPFLDFFINGDAPSDVNIRLVYCIYLANTVLSYFLFAYRKSLLNAFQRNDIITKISMFLLFAQYALQIGLLFIIKNYYLYLLVLPVITLANNIITNIVTRKLFPHYTEHGTVPKETTARIKKQVGGIFISKLCGTTRNSLDSIFISMFLGLTDVAIYGNYYYILSGVHSILTVFNTSMMGGVGNSLVSESKEKNFRDFRKFTFMYSWLSGWCACCMLCLYQHFMRIWVGDSLLFPVSTMVLFCLYLYVMAMTDIKNVYSTAAGLEWENRLRAFLEFAVNLVLNYLLGKYFGVVGILMATLITMFGINYLYGISILFRCYFTSESILKQYASGILYLIVTIAVSAVTYFVCELLPSSGILILLAKLMICMILPNLLFILCYHRTREFADSAKFFSSVLMRFTKKLHIRH